MINSIQYFQKEGIKRLIKIFEDYGKDFSKFDEMVYGVTEEVIKLGCSMIAEEWESYDELLRTRKDLRRGWWMTEDAVARILEEAADSTYRKGGANASISGSVMSKETVMNKLHDLKFPKILYQGEKKAVENLYIDADEDHVSL